MPTPEQVRAAVDGYAAHLQARDRGAWVALFAEGATLVDPAPGEPVVGHEAIGAFFDTLAGMAERYHLDQRDLHVCGPQAALEYTLTAGQAAGGGVAFDGVAVFTVDDEGRIAALTAYWEPSRLRQVDAPGAPPAP